MKTILSDILEKLEEEYKRVVIDGNCEPIEEEKDDSKDRLRAIEILAELPELEMISTRRSDTELLHSDELSEQMTIGRLNIIRERWSSYDRDSCPRYFSNCFLYDEDDTALIKEFLSIKKIIEDYKVDEFLTFCENFIKYIDGCKKRYKTNYFTLLGCTIFSMLPEELTLRTNSGMLSKFTKEIEAISFDKTKKYLSYSERQRYLIKSGRFLNLRQNFLESIIRLTALQISKTSYPDDMSNYRDESEFLLQVIFITQLFDTCNILEKFSLEVLQKIRALTLQYNDIIKKFNITKERREGESDIQFNTRHTAINLLEIFIEKLYNSPFTDILNKKLVLLEQSLRNAKEESSWLPPELLRAHTRIITPRRKKECKKHRKSKTTVIVEEDASDVEEQSQQEAPSPSSRVQEVELPLAASAELHVLQRVISADQRETRILLPEYDRAILKKSEFGLLFDEIIYSQGLLFERWMEQRECHDSECRVGLHTRVACFHDLRQRLQHYYKTRAFFEQLTGKLLLVGEQIHHRSHHITSVANLSLTNLLPISKELHHNIEEIIKKVSIKYPSLVSYGYLRYLKGQEWRIQEKDKISIDDLGIDMQNLVDVFKEYFKFLEKAGFARKDADENYTILRPISERYNREVLGYVEITDTVDYFIHICQHVKGFPLKIVLQNPNEAVQPLDLFANRVKFGGSSKFAEIFQDHTR